nr:L10-interacting MYB domain-containing protein-like [Tanacetum cinerariifolium]
MGACIEKLDKVGWAAQDPMYDTALLLFGQSVDYRKLWLHLKPESCGNWVKSVGSVVESNSEVEVVFDETANLRISTSGKDGSDKGYGPNSLLEQWRDS